MVKAAAAIPSQHLGGRESQVGQGHEPVIENWIKQVKDKGLDGNKLLEQARALVAKHDKA
jgi:hypothetical protein